MCASHMDGQLHPSPLAPLCIVFLKTLWYSPKRNGIRQTKARIRRADASAVDARSLEAQERLEGLVTKI